ncbi:MAG: hypothetical protein ACFB8W_22415, partial [Elainellaceae cyanobacterium]
KETHHRQSLPSLKLSERQQLPECSAIYFAIAQQKDCADAEGRSHLNMKGAIASMNEGGRSLRVVGGRSPVQ